MENKQYPPRWEVDFSNPNANKITTGTTTGKPMKRIDKLWIRPKGQNGLELHPKANIEECMKGYEKRVGICIKEVDVLSIFHKIECVKLSISAHHDCIENSEFEYMIETLNEIKELITNSI